MSGVVSIPEHRSAPLHSRPARAEQEVRSGVLVLCPMRIEFLAVARALRDFPKDQRPVLAQTGIGKDAIMACLETHLRRGGVHAAILAGACGGLVQVDDVPPIARVVDEHGRTWTPRLGAVPSGVVLVAVDRVVETPADKRALASQTGASIVDMEAHAFAAACERAGLAWGVVRGVSDTPDQTLPGEVLRWISPSGDTLALRAAWDLATRPGLIPHVARVLRRSRRVLPQVGQAVRALVEQCRPAAMDALNLKHQ